MEKMTAKELLKGVWFWFVALFTVPAFAGWLGYFAHVLASPHFEIEETALSIAGRFALLALTPWIILAAFLVCLFLFGGRR